jgi:hypothetical protein
LKEFRGLELIGVEGRVPGRGDGEAVGRAERPADDEREWERDCERDCVRDCVRECADTLGTDDVSFVDEAYGEDGRVAGFVWVLGT